MSLNRLPRGLGNTSAFPLLSVRAASRTCSARRVRGTRCSRFALVRVAGTVHTWSSVSISAHSAPRTSPDLAAVNTRKLERQLDDGSRPRRPHRLDHRRHVAMRQRRHVPDEILLRSEDRPDAAARVVVAVVQPHGVLHDRADTLANPPGRRRPLVPDLAERLDHVGARHLGDGQLAEAREREPFHARQPVLAVLGVAPAGPHLRQDRLGGGGEGGHAFEAALLGERIAARAGEPAVGEGLGAGVLERDEREAAEPEFAATAADDEPLYPAARTGRLHVEVQAVAIAVPAGLCYVADEGGRERVARLPAAGLGGPGSCREFHGLPVFPSPNGGYWRIVVKPVNG